MNRLEGLDAITFRLGKIAVNGQAFELVVGIVLSRALGLSDEYGAVVGAKLGVAGALDVIETLVEGKQFGLDQTATKAWLRVARRAAQERNRDMHAPWVAVAEGTEHDHVLSRRTWHLTRKDPADLDRTVVALRKAIVGGQRLVGGEIGAYGGEHGFLETSSDHGQAAGQRGEGPASSSGG